MFNFFLDEQYKKDDCYYIYSDNSDYNHIKNVLRMSIADELLISSNGESHLCEIIEVCDQYIKAKISIENYNDTSLPISIHLFQGLPKSDKMEFVIQKAVELGADEIIPVETENCVVKLDSKKKDSKVARWQAICESAAKQSKRNTIPRVSKVMSFKNALEKSKELDVVLIPYENEEGMATTKKALKSIKSGMSVGIFIGPEGGFDDREVDIATEMGAVSISLGKRILRTETAAITAVGMCMLYAETELCND